MFRKQRLEIVSAEISFRVGNIRAGFIQLETNAADQRFREYLLGRLAGETREEFEAQLLTDNELYEELVIAEDELVDDYLRDELSPADRENFESHFAAAPEHHEKVRFARALKRYVKARALSQRSADVLSAEKSETLARVAEPQKKRPLLSFLPFQNPIVSYSLAAAMVLVVVGVGWIAWKNLINPPRDQGQVLAVTLTPGLQRSEGETKRLTISSDIGTVRLQLILPENRYESYQATLLDFDGRTLTTKTNLKPETANGQPATFFDVLADLMSPGDYRVRLSGVASGGNVESVASYSFRILK